MNSPPPPPPRTTVVAVLLLALLSATGCVHESQSQTPADVDIATPPPESDEPQRFQPDDSGHYWTLASIGRIQWEIGRIGGEEERARGRNWGAEISSGGGRTEDADLFYVLGLGAGCAPCLSSDPEQRRFYGEVHLASIEHGDPHQNLPPFSMRISTGWSVQPSAGIHGPQITMATSELFHFRWYRPIGHVSSFLFGVSLPAGFLSTKAR